MKDKYLGKSFWSKCNPGMIIEPVSIHDGYLYSCNIYEFDEELEEFVNMGTHLYYPWEFGAEI